MFVKLNQIRLRPLPTPVILGVMISMVPVSAPIVAGLVTTTIVYTGLSLLSEPNPELQKA